MVHENEKLYENVVHQCGFLEERVHHGFKESLPQTVN